MTAGTEDLVDWRMTRFRIGERLIDAAANEISREGERTIVRDKVMAGLVQLVAGGGRLVTKDELFAALWPGQTPSEESLTQVISELRRALGDTAKQAAVIRTVPKRGYALVAPVEIAEDEAPESIPALPVAAARAMGPLSSFVARRPQLFIALTVTAVLLQNVLRTLIHHH